MSNTLSLLRLPISRLTSRGGMALLWGLALLLLGGCATAGLTAVSPVATPGSETDELLPATVTLLADPVTSTATLSATVPISETVAENPEAAPQVTVRNRSVNIRSGPSTAFPVVGNARQGDTFQVVGRNEDATWWYICCIRGANDPEGQATQRAWISDIVVTANEAAAQTPVIRPLFPEDLTAVWSVSYRCESDRCPVQACEGTMSIQVTKADARWLELERSVTWDGDCGENSTWIHQIDRYTGEERYPVADELFTLRYWAGRDPGPVNAHVQVGAEQTVQAWCAREQEAELEESGGWVTVYRGTACYDAHLGMLVAMKYDKRWLFSGEYEGEVYDRAYFGDREIYEIRLEETNAPLTLAE